MGRLIHMREPRSASHICIAYEALYLDEYIKALRTEMMRPVGTHEMILSLAEDITFVEKLGGTHVFVKDNIRSPGMNDYRYMRIDKPFRLNDIYIKNAQSLYPQRHLATALVGVKLHGNRNSRILEMRR